MKDFFISYTSVDVKWATWVAWVLENAGYSVFIQAWDILPGENFVSEMQDAMTGTHKTIAILSEDYLKSDYTELEWTAAIARDPLGKSRLLVPIKVRPCTPTGILSVIVYVDITGHSEQDACAAIIGALGSRSNPDRLKPDEAPAFPTVKNEGRTIEAHAQFPGDTKHSAVNVTDKIMDTSATDDIMTAPLRQRLASGPGPVLTAKERINLRKSLDRLSPTQLNLLVFALGPPPDAVRPLPAPRDERVEMLLRWAEGPTGRGLAEVRNVFDEMLKPSDESQAEEPDADRGRDVVKVCDRRKQEEDFNTLFKLCCERRRGQAQFFIIHGREMEGHKSLVERFCATTLSRHAGGAKLMPWELGWPQTGDLKVDSERFVSLLFEQTAREDVAGSVSDRARAFREVATTLPPVVVIQHKIDARDWLSTTRKLIQSYIEFWDVLKRTEAEKPLPLFVIFLNAVYPIFQDRSRAPLRWWRLLRHNLMIARVRAGLKLLSNLKERSPLAVSSSSAQMASVALLKELTCVNLEDIKDWLGKHNYGEYDAELVERSQSIFIRNKWELFECKSMADVEWALSKFVTEMTPKKSAYT